MAEWNDRVGAWAARAGWSARMESPRDGKSIRERQCLSSCHNSFTKHFHPRHLPSAQQRSRGWLCLPIPRMRKPRPSTSDTQSDPPIRSPGSPPGAPRNSPPDRVHPPRAVLTNTQSCRHGGQGVSLSKERGVGQREEGRGCPLSSSSWLPGGNEVAAPVG